MRNPSRFLALIAAAAVLFCATVPRRATASPMNGTQQRQQFSSRQYFEGLFFGVGPVAKMTPELWAGHFNHNSTAANMRGLRYLEARINRHDPAYFATLRADLTSGDPGLVSRAIARTHADLQAVARISVSRSRVRPDAVPESTNVNYNYNYNYLVNINAGANINVVLLAVVAVILLVVALDSPQPQMTAFQREHLVASLARTLRLTAPSRA